MNPAILLGLLALRDARKAAEPALLIGLLVAVKISNWSLKGPPFWRPDMSDKGGKGAGTDATRAPVPQGAANVWSRVTMEVFVKQMQGVPIDPALVLLGIAAASNFNADEFLGSNVGLLLVNREDLANVGYPGVPPFEQTEAVYQIPWIAKVLAYRMAAAGGREPKTVGDLAVLLHPGNNPTITEAIRNESERRARDAEGKSIYIHHANLLRTVLANP